MIKQIIFFYHIFALQIPCTIFSTKPYHPDNMILIEIFDIYNGFSKVMISNKNILKGTSVVINDDRFNGYRIQRFSMCDKSAVKVSEFYFKDQIVPKNKVITLVSLFHKINTLFKGNSNFRDTVFNKCSFSNIKNGSKNFDISLYKKILISTLSEYKSYTRNSREEYFILFKNVLSRMFDIVYKKEKFPDMYKYIINMEEKNLYDLPDDLYEKIKRINDILEDRVLLLKIYLKSLVEFRK